MFFKTISCVVVMLAMVYGHVPASKPKAYVLESQQYLEDLVQKKKSKKNVPSLGILFDAYVDDAKKLLEGLDQQDSCDEQDAKKEAEKNGINMIPQHIVNDLEDPAPGLDKQVRIKFKTNIDPNEYIITSIYFWRISVAS